MYSALFMNNTCSKLLPTLFTQQACVVLHISLSQSPLWSIQCQCFRLYNSGLRKFGQLLQIIHAEGTILLITSSPIAGTKFNHLGGVKCMARCRNLFIILRKFSQQPMFRHQRDSNPQDYQTDALVHCAT